jgi:hypothetical protein
MMGFFEDLFDTIKEAIDEAKGQSTDGAPPSKPPVQRQPGQTAAPHPYDLMKAQQRAQAQADAEARARADAQTRAHIQAKAQAQAKAAAKPAAARARPASNSNAARAVQPPQIPVRTQSRLAQLLHQRQTLRDIFVLKEIFDKPLVLRNRR